jgi:hypothetical protein
MRHAGLGHLVYIFGKTWPCIDILKMQNVLQMMLSKLNLGTNAETTSQCKKFGLLSTMFS